MKRLNFLKKTVTLAGAAERLSATSIKTEGCSILALPSNAGNAFIGDSGVLASSENGIPIYNKGGYEIGDNELRGTDEEFDLYDLWIDVETSGEGVLIVYWKDT